MRSHGEDANTLRVLKVSSLFVFAVCAAETFALKGLPGAVSRLRMFC